MPGGSVNAGPLYDGEGILVADCDLRAGLHAKRGFDAVGHYSRADVLGEGGAAIVEPTWGKVVAGPLRGEEGVVVADCDLRAGLHAKRWFDAVGHYSRADVLTAPEDETAPA